MIIDFNKYIRESVENVVVRRSLDEIFNEFLFYDLVFDYLTKELNGKKVRVGRAMYIKDGVNQVFRNIAIDVKQVELDERSLIFYFLDKNGIKYRIPENVRMSWSKPMVRNFNESDPYGEED